MIKGLSGGEKKRTAVGVELVTCPDLLFLDEPTSGLDSYSATQCVDILRKVCKAGAVVICTIHQPSSKIFSMFQHCILMSDGRVLYQGNVDEMGSYFGSKGFPIPSNYNPADFVMDCVQTPDESGKQKEQLFMAAAFDTIEGIIEGRDNSAVASVTTSFFTQMKWLSWREGLALQRDVAGICLDSIFHIRCFVQDASVGIVYCIS